jgi:hypothetical protein
VRIIEVRGLAVRGVVLIVAILSTCSCGQKCAFRLALQLSFSSDPIRVGDAPIPVPCCGGFLFHDVNLNSADIQQVDIANGQVNAGHIDAFLVSADCAKLFDGPYNGSVVQPLCKIYMGPVAAGNVSDRQTLLPGSYRLFAQAWASNESEQRFDIDLGIWTDRCQLNPTAPTPR